MRFFVTGTAGFIGFHLARKLLESGHSVIGYDGVTPYYDQKLKRDRHALLGRYEKFRKHEHMLEDAPALEAALGGSKPDIIVHLAAQAGVRYSLENPSSYIDSNLRGTFNILELARKVQPQHLMIASTSSVYGGNQKMPFAETDRADFPVSLYAATKKACEAMSHSYSSLWNIPTTCFRFFTVYGPWGRPDMALFKFVKAIEAGQPIDVYGNGQMQRDFTYVDDLVESIARLTQAVPRRGEPVAAEKAEDSLSPVAPWRVVNIGGGAPVELMTFIALIEESLGKSALKNMMPMQKGDVVATASDARLLEALIGYVPMTDVATGVGRFVEWYRDYFRAENPARSASAH